MGIAVEYLNDDKTIFTVDYGAKRKARYNYEDINFSEEQEEFLNKIPLLVLTELNINAFKGMEDKKVFSLIEKLTRSICGLYTPRKNYDVSKEVIRAYVLDTLKYVDKQEGAKT